MNTRYIKQIRLQNFQDHEDSTIDFTNGINLIVGSSDAGKSAILRAINFVFHNNLKGDSFIRHGSKECRVSILFSDGVEITRVKGEDVNSYLFKDSEGNNHSYPKIGTTVPDEIKKQLGNPPLDDKKRPISYADQMSNLFLVDLSPTDLPRTLSELTGIQNLQTAAEVLSKNARSFDRSIKEKNDKIASLTTKLDEYSYVDKDLDKINKIAKKLEIINAALEKSKIARRYIERYNTLVSEYKKINSLLSLYNSIVALKDKIKDLAETEKNVSFAKTKLSHYNTLAAEFNSKKKTIKVLKEFISENNKQKIVDINKLMSDTDKAKVYISTYENVNIKISEADKVISDSKKEMNSKKLELKNLIKKLKDEGNWCSTCNRPLV